MDERQIAAYKEKFPEVFEQFGAYMPDDVIAAGIEEFDAKTRGELIVLAIENSIHRALLSETLTAVKKLGSIFANAAEAQANDDVHKA